MKCSKCQSNLREVLPVKSALKTCPNKDCEMFGIVVVAGIPDTPEKDCDHIWAEIEGHPDGHTYQCQKCLLTK